jgi:hypothetical protein
MSTEIQTTSNNQLSPKLDLAELMEIGKAFAESGMFPDVTKAAQAMVKIVAGHEIGIKPFAAMSGIHIIKGKTTIGAGIIASSVKGSGKYDYTINQLDDKACNIDFFEGKKKIGNSTFTIEDARKAGTQNLEKFPKNMLFARAISNGVKWYCPDVFNGPVYTPEEMETIDIPHSEEPKQHEPVIQLATVVIGSKVFTSAVKAIRNGKTFEEVEATANGAGWTFDNEEVKKALDAACEEVA